MVADGHGVGEAGQRLFYLVFDEDGRDVLAACGDDQFLDSAGDEQSFLLDPAEVSRMEEALDVDGLGGVFRVFKIPHTNVPAPHAYLSLLVLLAQFVDFHLGAGDGSAHLQIVLLLLGGEQLGVGAAFGRGALGHPVAVSEEHVEAEEIFADGGVEGRRPEDEDVALVESEGGFHFVVD